MREGDRKAMLYDFFDLHNVIGGYNSGKQELAKGSVLVNYMLPTPQLQLQILLPGLQITG